MNRILVSVLLLASAAAAPALFGEVQFAGLVVEGENTRFGLNDTETQQTGWLKIGEAFAGFTLTAYDPSTQTVVLTREGKEFRAALKTAAIMPPRPADDAGSRSHDYIVQPGDTGSMIARASGITLQELAALNPGVNWSRLTVGQKIRTP